MVSSREEKERELWELPVDEIYGQLDADWMQTLRETGEEFSRLRDEHSAAGLENLASQAVSAEKEAVR